MPIVLNCSLIILKFTKVLFILKALKEQTLEESDVNVLNGDILIGTIISALRVWYLKQLKGVLQKEALISRRSFACPPNERFDDVL